MAGLLYKDFVAIRGKVYVICAVVGMLLVALLRVNTNTDEMEYLLVMTMFCLVIFLFMLLNNKIETDILQVDEARKQKQYCVSLPVTKKQYVETKYVFMLLTIYFMQAFCTLLCNVLMIDYRTELCVNMLSVVGSLVPIISCIVLLVMSIELPFFIGFGYKKGNTLKQTIIVLIFFAVLIYLMFGDLSLFQNASVDALAEVILNNQDVMTALQVFSPCLTLIVYYISYRISCALFERREFEDD